MNRRPPTADLEPSVAEDIFEPGMAQPEAPNGTPIVTRATDLTGVHVLKHETLFMLCDAHGNIRPDDRGLGLFDGDTRVLSTFDLRLNGAYPIVLRAGPAASFRSSIQMTNPDLEDKPEDGRASTDGSHVVLRRQSLGIVRERFIGVGFGERVVVTNFTTRPERVRLSLRVDADFVDIFEVRGTARPRRGERLPNAVGEGWVELAYRGLDGLVRRTRIDVSPPMSVIEHIRQGELELELEWSIPAGGRESLRIEVRPELVRIGQDDDQHAEELHGHPPLSADGAAATHRSWQASSASIDTGHVFAERALERASADLRLLLNAGPEPGERYIAAGVPWFSCLFGRDSIIASLQLLSIRPQVAQSTLALLARLQATEVDDFRDAQPGKILHELRSGELANTGEIPHTPYYGTVDATPLWLMLLDEYESWTGDAELIDRLWPNALAALRWIDDYGDSDGDGFVEYERHSRRGLASQGWKDSPDSIRNSDGSLADGPVALVEVQGYVFAARLAVARLARLRGEGDLADQQDAAAATLRERFEKEFWMEHAGTYALALDGDKRQVTGIASNAGHALWSGIASPARAASVAQVLTGPGMWSGWGIRTLSEDTAGYNPIGYHLGTVWPHDNGICAAGFARYGLLDQARQVAGAMLEATTHFRESRLPELFCGFDRAASPLPVPYPVACSPQAWAAGSLFHLVASMLGLRPNAREQRLEIVRPALPAWLPGLRLRNLRVGQALVDLEFDAAGESISVEVLRRTGELDVVVRL
ncbi:amylo-alpha-1,6-glucosidase [soil metagenome]